MAFVLILSHAHTAFTFSLTFFDSAFARYCIVLGGGWPIFALHHCHGGCPILALFARVGEDGAGATFVRSTLPVVYAVVVPALRLREGRGTRICGGFCSSKAGPPATYSTKRIAVFP
jgi:hypothetical protein